MSFIKNKGCGNRLLDALSAADRSRFVADCCPAELILDDVLYEQGDRIAYVYFPTESFISMLTTIDDNSTLEVGMAGNEGMCGFALLLGVDTSPQRALVQGPGSAWRMQSNVFRKHLVAMPGLRNRLNRYVYVLQSQLARTAACTRFHIVEQRLARWLLMTQDRAHQSVFAVTQEFLAYMLGVRRVGVTQAAGSMQLQGLIAYTRGKMTILNRSGLESAACTCYHSDLQTYDGKLTAR